MGAEARVRTEKEARPQSVAHPMTRMKRQKEQFNLDRKVWIVAFSLQMDAVKEANDGGHVAAVARVCVRAVRLCVRLRSQY